MFKVITTIGVIQALAILINFIRAKTVAVLLGPEGVGVISTIDQVVQSAAPIIALSIPFTALKFLSKAHSESHESFQRIFSSLLKILLLLSAIGMTVTISLVVFGHNLLDVEIARYRVGLI